MALKGSFALLIMAGRTSFAGRHICCVHAHILVDLMFALLPLSNCHSVTWHVAMFIHASWLIGVLLTYMHIILVTYNVPYIRGSMF